MRKEPLLPYHFCTYFDANYLTRGLALYKSLCSHCGRPFILWVLCFDDETYATLSRLNLPGVRLIAQQEFEADDEALVRAKADRSRVEYYWTCTPSLPLYVLRHDPEVGLITYLDADLYFYSDPEPIYDELGDGSILIVEHRYASEYAYFAQRAGVYNLGWMSFRRDANGLECLAWWRERCLEWCYSRYEDGKFGDQLYLNDWPERFYGVVILKHKGAGLAPWNVSKYHLEIKKGHLYIDNEPLIFFHFHGFRCINEHVVAPAGFKYHLPKIVISEIILPYAKVLLNLSRQHKLPFVDTRNRPHRLRFFIGFFRQQLLLISPRWISLQLWNTSMFFKPFLGIVSLVIKKLTRFYH